MELLRTHLLLFGTPFFAIGMLWMFAAELFLAMPLHAGMSAYRVTSMRSYALAGAVTGTAAALISVAVGGYFPNNSLFLRYMTVCLLAGFVGGSVFWAIAVCERRRI